MGAVKRNGNVEVFRCFLMFLIVLWHCYVHGFYHSSTEWWTELYPLFLMWHVDGFVAISGWFGIRFAWSKVLRLYGVILLYSIASICVRLLFAPETFKLKHLTVTGGWFGGTYLGLMFLAPLINRGLDTLLSESKKRVYAVFGLFVAVVTLAWIPTHLFTAVVPSGSGGYTIFTMIFVYSAAYLVRRVEINASARLVTGIAGVCCLFTIALSLGYSMLRVVSGCEFELIAFKCSYDSPFVWGLAIALLMLFVRHIRFPDWLCKTSSFIGPSTFCIYLLHDTTSFGQSLYRIPETWLSQHTSWHPMLIILLCSVSTFLICLAVDLLRRAAFSFVRPRVTHVLQRIDERWDLWLAK